MFRNQCRRSILLAINLFRVRRKPPDTWLNARTYLSASCFYRRQIIVYTLVKQKKVGDAFKLY